MAKRRLLDRALGLLGLRRIASAVRGGYAGAKANALTADWFAAMLSADQAIKGDLRRLRDRARELVRNFGYASRFVQSCQENIIGPDGIRLQVRVPTKGGTVTTALNDEVEAKWKLWCEKESCCVDGQLAFVDVEHLIVETLPQDGEVIIRMVEGFPDNDFRFALQVMDADQLDETLVRGPDENGDHEIRFGVEVNRWGKPVAYWMWTQHPSEYGRGIKRRERVPAEQIIYIGLRRRPGQTRAVPWFAPILIDERMLAGWQEASINAARFGALSQFFLKRDAEKAGDTEPIPADYSLDLEPGSVGQVLPDGYDLATFDPKYPNAEFDPFRNAILQSIAAGLRVSALTLTGDLRNANYSSMRAGLLPEREAWKLLAKWLTRHFHARVYRAWVRTAVLSGALEVPPRQLAAVLAAATWQTRGWQWVDPLNDVQAEERALNLGLTSRTVLAAGRGLDFGELVKQLAEENATADAADVHVAGTDFPAAPRQDVVASDATAADAPARALRLARARHA